MKVITCASFYGSGSSAVVDFVSEFDNVNNLGNYEFRFLHDIDGVSDLQYHLVECPNRHNSGHALKRYKKLASFFSGSRIEKRYEPFFNNQFMKLTNQYIDSLTEFKYKGWWFYDLYDKGRFHYLFMQVINHFLRIFTKKQNNILKKEFTLCPTSSADAFIDATRNYTHNLLLAANKTNSPFLAIDQIVSSQNSARILNYFKDEVFVFIVDRDPRDIYLCERLKWNESVVPHDPFLFSQWYKHSRKNYKQSLNNENVVFIQFEDLIYNYEQTTKKIMDKTGLKDENHFLKFSRFNPKKSVVNTQIFKRVHKFDKEIKIIEKELKEYLYNFDNNQTETICGQNIKNPEIF